MQKLNLDKEKLKNQFLNGASITQLASIYNCSDASIRNILKSFEDVEIDTQMRRRNYKTYREQLVVDYLTGKSIDELARLYDRLPHNIRSILLLSDNISVYKNLFSYESQTEVMRACLDEILPHYMNKDYFRVSTLLMKHLATEEERIKNKT